ncbi:MAG: hypothetical protein U5O39_15455 [Gammaproteobacteria bacterium]|nr:hypothetical protein [Gammaproteobacteria bacterium]
MIRFEVEGAGAGRAWLPCRSAGQGRHGLHSAPRIDPGLLYDEAKEEEIMSKLQAFDDDLLMTTTVLEER